MYAPNLRANGLNVVDIVKEKIDKPVFLQNDGMCAGLAEKEYGALRKSKNGIFLGIGTGIGVAVFINDKLMPEIREAGHTIIVKGRKTM